VEIASPPKVPALASPKGGSPAEWETPQRGIVPARVVEHQPEINGIRILPGVSILRWGCAGFIAHLTPCRVAHLGDLVSAAIGSDACRTQVVGQEVFHLHVLRDGVFSHRDPGCACIVILRHGRVGHFIIVDHESRGDIIDDAGQLIYANSNIIKITNI